MIFGRDRCQHTFSDSDEDEKAEALAAMAGNSSDITADNIIKLKLEEVPEQAWRQFLELLRKGDEEHTKRRKQREEEELKCLLSCFTRNPQGGVTQIKKNLIIFFPIAAYLVRRLVQLFLQI